MTYIKSLIAIVIVSLSLSNNSYAQKKAPKPPKGAAQLPSTSLFTVSSPNGLITCGQVKGWESGKMVGKNKAFFMPLRVEINQFKKEVETEEDEKKLKKLRLKHKYNAEFCKNGPPVATPTPTPIPTETPPPLDALQAKTSPLTYEDINHLYRRAGLGVPTDYALTLVNQNSNELVNHFMTYIDEPDVETEARTWLDENIAAPHFPTSLPSQIGINLYALRLLAKTKNQFHERLALLALHDRLATSSMAISDSGSKLYLMINHLNLIRNIGSREMNYAKLVEEIGEDAVMVRWLSLDKNTKRAPNENYAREVMELFSLDTKNDAGEDNYTNTDIIQVARAFTGWNLLRFDQDWNVIFVPNNFDDDPNKVIFEGTPYEGKVNNGRDVVKHIFAKHPNAPRSLAKFIAREYLREDVSPEVINYLSYLIKQNNFVLKPVFEKLFNSEEFYKAENQFSIAKAPVERFIHLLRIMEKVGMPYNFRTVRDRLSEMGCVLTIPESVFGCDKMEELPDGQRILTSANLITTLSNDSTLFTSNNWSYARFFPQGTNTPTADQVIDSMLGSFGLTVNIQTKAAFRDYMNSLMNNNGTLSSENWNPQNTSHVRRKVAGLFRIIATMPQMHDLR